MISNYVDMYGEWSETEVDLFRFLLNKASNCVEVGSNIGMHTIPISRFCEDGQIICFEPQRVIFNILCGNAAINNRTNIYARCEAVGETNKSIEIESSDYDEPCNYGSFSVSAGFSMEGSYAAKTQKIRTQMVSLDNDEQIQSLPTLDLLKIDAEGHEPLVISGARHVIEKHKPNIFLEANQRDSMTQCFSSLSEMGYIGYWFASQRYRKDNFNRNPFSVTGYDINIIYRHVSKDAPALPLPRVVSFDDIAKGIPVLSKFD